MTVTRDRHPLCGRELRVLGRMRRHGSVELLVVLPDGSKTLLPVGFTDAGPTAVEGGAATAGSVDDLLGLAVVVESLIPTRAGAVRPVEDATGIPAKEGFCASDQSVGVRSRRRGARGAAGGGSAAGGPAGAGSAGGGPEVGVPDRQVPRRGGVGR